jgi:hypothetical protein
MFAPCSLPAMNPLSALSLAGTIIQFVDFGRKLLGGAVDIYRSASRSLAVNDEIELEATDLKELVVKLRVLGPTKL